MVKTDIDCLEVLSSLMASEVGLAMQASIVIAAARVEFVLHREWFARNPANTLPFIALQALEKGATVTIAEVLNDEENAFPVSVTIRRKVDLIAHRHSISHPVTVNWHQQKMQAFKEQGREWLELRAALIWDMQRSINEELKLGGRQTLNDEVVITPAMAMLLDLIFRLSAQPEALPHLCRPTEEMEANLQMFRDAYLDFIVEHVEGTDKGLEKSD